MDPIRDIQLTLWAPTPVGLSDERDLSIDPDPEDLLIELEGDIGDDGSDEGIAGGEDDGNLPVEFSSDLINSDGTIKIGLLGERSVGTIAYGVILSIIGYIEFIGSGIVAWTSGLAGFIESYIRAIYSGAGSSDGLIGAVDAATTGIDVWLDPLGILALPISILIGMALGIVVIRVTLAGIEIILGTNL